MNLIPGEPIPPGFEDEVNREPKIQKTVDQYKGNALIGIEYTVELHEDDRVEPGYLCTLCDKRGDPRTIINHWSSFNHRMKYLEKHYPSAVREFQPVKYKPNSHNIMILIVQRLAEAIEDHHGRLRVTTINADEFRRRKTAITEQVMQKQHYDENIGPNFLNAIDRTLWEQKSNINKKDANVITKAAKRTNTNPDAGGKKLNNKDGLDEISSEDENIDAAKKKKINRVQEPAYTKARNLLAANVEREKDSENKLPTPKELSLQASHIAQERYKWEKYRCMLEIQLKQMEKIQQEYEKSPEKHPHYPEEWKKFWNRRYKELQAEKKVDPNKYDYKPEWIVYWTIRMKELFNSEVDKKKKEIKIKLGLPEDAEEKIDQLKEKYKVPINRLNKQPVRAGPPIDVIDISDDESPHNARFSRSRRSRSRSRSRSPPNRGGRQHRDYHRRSRSRSNSRSLSPFSDEYELTNSAKHHHLMKRHHNPPIRGYNPIETYSYVRPPRYPPTSSVPSHYPPPDGRHYRILDPSKIPKYEESDSRSTKDSKEETPKEEEPEGPLTVVAVLRLLTALEDHLGSLGPKVVDLLGKALALEKVKGNSSDELLMNDDHCVFFETIKEKLKGLLIADVMEDQHKVKATKRAIKNIAAIIHQVTTKGPSSEAKTDDQNENTKDSPSSSFQTKKNKPGGANLKDLPFDRQTVATKMAAALVMQGREDVSTDDMDKLIFMFILMVKLSKPKREDDGKPIYCKDILPQLGLAPIPIKTTTTFAALPAIVDELLENEVTSLVHEVGDEIDNEPPPSNKEEPKNDGSSNMLESLTDSDLQTLLQNFKHLSSEEQHHLIAHLKKLESADPRRVEKLRKFVNISDITGTKELSSKLTKSSDGTPTKSSSSRSKSHLNEDSPASSSKKSKNGAPPGTEDDDDNNDNRRHVNPNKFSLDDDEDDDYNFDEVFRAASSNVNRLSEEHVRQPEKSKSPIIPVSSSPTSLTFNPAGLKSTLNDTQNLIANLMGSLQQSNFNSKTSNNKPSSAPKPVPIPKPQPVPALGTPAVQQAPNEMAYYQQQQPQQSYPAAAYNQMNNPQPAGYYNMTGYNQNSYNAAGYQQWGQAPAPPQMQQFGLQNFGMANQPPQQMGYNMYGQGRN